MEGHAHNGTYACLYRPLINPDMGQHLSIDPVFQTVAELIGSLSVMQAAKGA